uniref:Uncharacterized protein n=1 Tax=Phlegmariurus squarrosus TaxID=73615 RepID=H9M855_PHLSQ|nr:hypothetical protein HusqMp71 [Phlegmariurus squarrosus]AEV55762.1 hypothetical protein HusqMp71 [Phlegmariurus squarrosus]
MYYARLVFAAGPKFLGLSIVGPCLPKSFSTYGARQFDISRSVISFGSGVFFLTSYKSARSMLFSDQLGSYAEAELERRERILPSRETRELVPTAPPSLPFEKKDAKR